MTGTPDPPGRSPLGLLYALFFASGASALIFQSCWQRVLSLHAGMDLYSVTTVVSAFMAGLGAGSLIGGALADRLAGPRRVVALYAVVELAIGAFGLFSLSLLYGRYRALAPGITSTWAAFLVHFALLSIPTCLMGMTLPLLARGVVRRQAEIAGQVGRLYGANTTGAACGALLTSGAWALRDLGLEGMVAAASAVNLACGVAALLLWRTAGRAAAGVELADAAPAAARGSPAFWIAVYGFTGFVSLGLEVVWFRLLNVLMSSNTFTFSRLLAGYLIGLGAGAFAGARWFRSVRRPDVLFLVLQGAVGLLAMLGPLLVLAYLEVIGIRLGMRNFVAPAVILVPTTFVMGLCFPLIQRVVSERVETLGRRTGWLLFSNTLGCVAGTLLTGFFLLDRLGTPRTLALLALALLVPGSAAAALLSQGRARPALLGSGAVLAAAAVALLPSTERFWSLLHGFTPDRIAVHEDGACVTALGDDGGGQRMMMVSGERQNAVPFDHFHLRLGTVPALVHPAPRQALVIGLGAGSSAYGVLLDRRLEQVACVEICGGELALLSGVRGKLPEIDRLLGDPRLWLQVRDGRRFLLEDERRYDLVVTDTLLTHSAFSGSLYSHEFYRLVLQRLNPGGLFAQWVPTERVLQTVAHVFPHVVELHSTRLEGEPGFLLASDRPIEIDPATLLERFRQMDAGTLRPEQRENLEAFVSTLAGYPVSPALAEGELNRDLFPRDEYSKTW